jgi:diguanylate cyclase (GGDEF)-like protein
LEVGILFKAWGVYIITMMLYAVIVLIKGFFFYYRTNREKSNGLLFFLIATIIWNAAGVIDALTSMQIIDLPPLTWVGSMVMILCIEIMLVTKIENLYSQISSLYEKVIHDHSIDVFSRNYFELQLDKVLKSNVDTGLSYYLIFIDIDDFKKINDTYGHLCGDYVLKHIVEIMNSNLRKPDIIARYGGDEFVVLMASREGAEVTTKIIERLRLKISDENFEFLTSIFHVTCSFGIVLIDKNSYVKAAKTRDEIIALADSALYHSKRLGKNRVYTLNIGN